MKESNAAGEAPLDFLGEWMIGVRMEELLDRMTRRRQELEDLFIEEGRGDTSAQDMLKEVRIPE